MRRFLAVLLVLLIVTVVLTSCDSVDVIRPVSDLLSAPLYYEEYEELVDAFNNSVGGETVLCSPKKGDNKSAIIINDIDGDGATEALIFYKSATDTSVVRLHYFKMSSDNWVSNGDFNGYGNEVENVVIDDMDGDGFKELIVTWSISGVSSSNVMSIYRATKMTGRFKEISNESCTVSAVLDIDSDGKKEIFYISQSNPLGVMQKSAKAMRISGDSVIHMGETKLDPNISSYYSMKIEKAGGDSPLKIYIDAFKGESNMITELIYWDKYKKELTAPLLDPETVSNNVTLRFEPIPCSDVNNDGVIDIPVQTGIFGKGDDTVTIDTENIYLTEWRNYDSISESVTVANTLINYPDGYMIFLNKNELDTLGIRNYRSQNCWVVYKYDSGNGEAKELYSVMKVSSARWNKETFKSYIPISEKNDFTVCVYITPNGQKSGIDNNYIKSKITKLP